MKNNVDRINFAQVFMMFSLANGLASHVIVNPMILEASGRDSWITALVSGGLFLLWMPLLYIIMKRSGQQHWKKWLSSRVTPFVAWLLIIPIVIQMFLIGGMTVIHTTTWTATNYLPFTPKLMLVGCLILFCAAMTLWGIRVIAIVSGILLPLVTVLGIFVSTFNGPHKDYTLLQPILENGVQPVMDGVVYAGAGYVELLAIILLQHHLNKKIKMWKLLAYGVFSSIITLGPILGAITEFGPVEATHQMTSPYEQWRLVQIGQFIEHLDFLSIFQWMSGASIRISLSVYLLVELLQIKRKRSKYWAIGIIMASYTVLTQFNVNEYAFYTWMYKYYMPISLIILLALSFVWMLVALVWGSAKREEAT